MINNQLIDYIKQKKQEGTSESEIKDILISQGWQVQDLEEAFLQVNGSEKTLAPVQKKNKTNLIPGSNNRKTRVFFGILVSLFIVLGVSVFISFNFSQNRPANESIVNTNNTPKDVNPVVFVSTHQGSLSTNILYIYDLNSGTKKEAISPLGSTKIKHTLSPEDWNSESPVLPIIEYKSIEDILKTGDESKPIYIFNPYENTVVATVVDEDPLYKPIWIDKDKIAYAQSNNSLEYISTSGFYGTQERSTTVSLGSGNIRIRATGRQPFLFPVIETGAEIEVSDSQQVFTLDSPGMPIGVFENEIVFLDFSKYRITEGGLVTVLNTNTKEQSQFRIYLDPPMNSLDIQVRPISGTIVVHRAYNSKGSSSRKEIITEYDLHGKELRVIYERDLNPDENAIGPAHLQMGSSFVIDPTDTWLLKYEGGNDWSAQNTEFSIVAINLETGKKQILCDRDCIFLQVPSSNRFIDHIR